MKTKIRLILALSLVSPLFAYAQREQDIRPDGKYSGPPPGVKVTPAPLPDADEDDMHEPLPETREAPAERAAPTGTPATPPMPRMVQEPDGVNKSEIPRETPGRSLPEQRLHVAAFPGEAELRCGILDSCVMGLTRGFVVGSDIGSLIAAPLVWPMVEPGSWLYADGFLGYQVLENSDNTYWANAALGYRRFSFKDSQSTKMTSDGFFLRINYAQKITPQYTQALAFEGFSVETDISDKRNIYDVTADGKTVRESIDKFYRYSNYYPRLRLGMPADVEVLSLSPQDRPDLPGTLRGYVSVEPFYAENFFYIKDHIDYVEKNFGLRAGATVALESAKLDTAGRWAVLSRVGFEGASETNEFSADGKSDTNGKRPSFPRRPAFSAFLEVMGSYQF